MPLEESVAVASIAGATEKPAVTALTESRHTGRGSIPDILELRLIRRDLLLRNGNPACLVSKN